MAEKFMLDKEQKTAIAAIIANSQKKWTGKAAELFLGAILRKAGLDADMIDGIVDAATWHGAVINQSQFAQWVDENDALKLGYKLRNSKKEKDAEAVAAQLEAMGL